MGKFEVDPLDIEGARAADAAAKAMSNENHCESFQCQVIGRRRVLLISPELSYKGLYPYPIPHPYDGYAMANLDDADYSRHPRLAEVHGAAAICEPGDVLFIPDSWWRHEQGLHRSTPPWRSGSARACAPGPPPRPCYTWAGSWRIA